MIDSAWTALRAASDYREFLRAYLKSRGLAASVLSRGAGFERRFASDVVSGRRRLTARSCHAFERALKLPVPARKLFRFLVARDERDAFPHLAEAEIRQRIDQLRAQAWETRRRTVGMDRILGAGQVLEDPVALAVFAAGGEPGRRVSLERLLTRTRLPRRKIESSLQALVAAGLFKRHGTQGDEYEPSDLHLFFQADGLEASFVRMFQLACRMASGRVETRLASDREMFFSSAFCVREARLPELKEALRATALEFVDTAIDAEGDRVARLLVGLHL